MVGNVAQMAESGTPPADFDVRIRAYAILDRLQEIVRMRTSSLTSHDLVACAVDLDGIRRRTGPEDLPASVINHESPFRAVVPSKGWNR